MSGGNAYLGTPSTGLPVCFRLVSPPFMVEDAFADGRPPALDCADGVLTLLPEVPLAAAAAVVMEVMTNLAFTSRCETSHDPRPVR
jgi:hypothetical protein